MHYSLTYGDGSIPLTLDDDHFDVTTFLPKDNPGLPAPLEAFREAVRHPNGGTPLAELGQRFQNREPTVVIVIADHTRPVPDHQLVPWIVEALAVPDRCITILIGTGSHRPSTDEEIGQKLGDATVRRFTVVNHHPTDPRACTPVGTSQCGGVCRLNNLYVNADIRIATGFIEPHFFAGFSGGSKSIMPGIAALETVRYFHRASLIADPRTTWGDITDNPTQALTREMVAMCPPDCIVNVTLNLQREITGIFAGDVVAAHTAGCARARDEAMIAVSRPYPVVVTTNSGYPLDQNFYQAVKGMSAAARIVEPGGVILAASECRNGLPSEGEFAKILADDMSSEELLASFHAAGETRHDQWEVQTLLQIQRKARVILYSHLSNVDKQLTRTEITSDLSATLEELQAASAEPRLRVALLPMGPLTIPTLASTVEESLS